MFCHNISESQQLQLEYNLSQVIEQLWVKYLPLLYIQTCNLVTMGMTVC